MVDEVVSRGPGKDPLCYVSFFKVTFHMAASNYYQPFDKCNINCFNIIKHYDACAFLSRMAVSSDF